MRFRYLLPIAVVGFVCLTAVGCQSGGATDGPTPAGLQAAVVPGADFLLRVDYTAMTQSVILEKLETNEAPSTPATTGRWAQFFETTGLGTESLEGLLVSMDLDSIDLSAGGDQGAQMEATRAVLAVSLDTPVTHEDIVTGVAAANAEGRAVASIDESHGARMVRIEIEEEAETRTVYGAPSSEGDTVYFSMNAPSVRGALEREASGALESIPDTLKAAEAALAPNAQVRMAFLAPASWRAKISEQAANPSGGMAGGMLSPLKDLQSIAMGMEFDAEMQVQLVGDLGNEEAAGQASAFLQMMVLPMLQSAMAENGSDASADKLDVSVQGTVLQLGMSFTEAEVAAFRDKASAMAPAAMDGSGY